jgi:hypothetical protein
MLYPQIPPSILERISAELKISVGLLAATWRTPDASSVDSLYAQTAVLDEYIRAHEDVGSVQNPGSADAPKDYIAGTLLIGRGIIEDDEEDVRLACFAGRYDSTRLVMVGAVDSLVGMPDEVGSVHYVDYYDGNFYYWAGLRALRFGTKPKPKERREIEREAMRALEDDRETLGRWADYAIDEVADKMQSLDFLAQVLYFEEKPQKVLIASPIYVALA